MLLLRTDQRGVTFARGSLTRLVLSFHLGTDAYQCALAPPRLPTSCVSVTGTDGPEKEEEEEEEECALAQHTAFLQCVISPNVCVWKEKEEEEEAGAVG